MLSVFQCYLLKFSHEPFPLLFVHAINFLPRFVRIFVWTDRSKPSAPLCSGEIQLLKWEVLANCKKKHDKLLIPCSDGEELKTLVSDKEDFSSSSGTWKESYHRYFTCAPNPASPVPVPSWEPSRPHMECQWESSQAVLCCSLLKIFMYVVGFFSPFYFLHKFFPVGRGSLWESSYKCLWELGCFIRAIKCDV